MTSKREGRLRESEGGCSKAPQRSEMADQTRHGGANPKDMSSLYYVSVITLISADPRPSARYRQHELTDSSASPKGHALRFASLSHRLSPAAYVTPKSSRNRKSQECHTVTSLALRRGSDLPVCSYSIKSYNCFALAR